MNNMQSVTINKKRYYNLDDIKSHHPGFVYGLTTIEQIIEVRNVPDCDHIKMIEIDGVSKCLQARTFIREKWFNENYDFDNEIKKAPDIISFDDNDIFVLRGAAIDFEIRGERTTDKCFFLASDVIRHFSCKSSVKNMSSSDSYKELIDYTYFFVENEKTHKYKKHMYITYCGLMKIIINRKKKDDNVSIKWINNIINKDNFEDEYISPDNVYCIFGKGMLPVSSIYLIKLGTVGDLRKLFKIDKSYPDNWIVYKFGRTKDLKKRTKNHDDNYGNMEGVVLSLSTYGQIDPSCLKDAEHIIINFMKENNYKLNGYCELVAIPKNKMIAVREIYTSTTKTYNDELVNTRRELVTTNENVKKLEDLVRDLRNSIKSKDSLIEILEEKQANLEKTK